MRREGEKRDRKPSNSSKKRKAISSENKNQFLELSENWRDFFSEANENYVGTRVPKINSSGEEL
jgi:hypothetical protein